MKRTPPLRAGFDPLIKVGLIDASLSREKDVFFDFLMFCEMTFRENLALRAELKRCKVDPEEYLRSREFPPGSTGRHRLVFDGWYLRLADFLPTRLRRPGGRAH